MRVVVQRVKEASVNIEQVEVSRIKQGYLLYIGISDTDTKEIAHKVAAKIKNLRIFEDDQEKMNLNLNAVKGSILAVSQFTLYGDTKGNNRPSFIKAARPEQAKALYDVLVSDLAKDFMVKTGIFQAHMEISSINDGPVTIIIEIDWQTKTKKDKIK